MFKWEVEGTLRAGDARVPSVPATSRTLTDRGADDSAPRLEAPTSHAHASLRAPRSVNVARNADRRVGFVTWLIFAAVLFELAYRIVW